ncbi:DUF2726 domain-containing protein [Pseudoduganella violaceinigra]|uniref:DUF2726 domain-containing protein n=1 Tax=Pseudoduganella violaceinigra TaxID=246602 RepID=UPI001B7F82B9|nr:DUF2726 domain-containing protein [Pseudoduganella violaceinigra]
MKSLFLTTFLIVFALGVLGAILSTQKKAKRGLGKITRKAPLTENEQPMYFRLTQAFPDHVVLAQVAFSALLTAKDMGTRNRFDRKIADFVICTKSFEVLAIIELDDSSHLSKVNQDAARDQMLAAAGYTTLRYKMVPDVLKVRADIAALQPAPKNIKAA